MPLTPRSAPRRQWSSQSTPWFIRSLFGRSESAHRPPSSPQLTMTHLNEDILRHIVPYLSPEALDRVKATNYVFFDAWMKSRYETLSFVKNDQEGKRLLHHLSDTNAAPYVKKVLIRPWLVRPRPITYETLSQSLWVNFNEILDPDYIEKETARRLQKRIRKDIALVVAAFNAMENIKEYSIDWDEDSGYHPELYNAFLAPILQKWTERLVKLTIKVPPHLLKPIASVRLMNLETLEYHFSTGVMSSRDIDEVHTGFLVFVNNLKDSLECISFISTSTSRNLDIAQIYKSLGLFPKLHSVLLSIPFDGGHLSDPLVFVEFLEKHRSTLKTISLSTSRCTIHSTPNDLERINWIQKILTSVDNPFPRLQNLVLAIRPLRAPLTNVSNFIKMHASTLDSLILADRALDYHEFGALMETANGTLELKHLRIKLHNFSPNILYYLASEMSGLKSLDIECSPTRESEFGTFSKEIIASKHLLVNWNLQRMAIGPPDYTRYVERALVECIPNLMIAFSWYTVK